MQRNTIDISNEWVDLDKYFGIENNYKSSVE